MVEGKKSDAIFIRALGKLELAPSNLTGTVTVLKCLPALEYLLRRQGMNATVKADKVQLINFNYQIRLTIYGWLSSTEDTKFAGIKRHLGGNK